MAQVLKSIRGEERKKQEDSDNDSSDGSGGPDLNDDLDDEEEKRLISNIFDTMNEFANLNNLNGSFRVPTSIKKKRKAKQSIEPIIEEKKSEPTPL